MEEPRSVKLLNRWSPAIHWILRSPFHWLLSPGLMLVTVTGRRSGRVYTIPVGYHALDGEVVVMVSDAPNRSWWRNFLDPASATLRIKGRVRPARGRALGPDDPEFAQRAEQSFRRARYMGRIFGIEFDPTEGLRPEQVVGLGEYARIVVFELEQGE